jgi:hypothetical protein
MYTLAHCKQIFDASALSIVQLENVFDKVSLAKSAMPPVMSSQYGPVPQLAASPAPAPLRDLGNVTSTPHAPPVTRSSPGHVLVAAAPGTPGASRSTAVQRAGERLCARWSVVVVDKTFSVAERTETTSKTPVSSPDNQRERMTARLHCDVVIAGLSVNRVSSKSPKIVRSMTPLAALHASVVEEEHGEASDDVDVVLVDEDNE